MDPFRHDPELLDAFRQGKAHALDRVYRSFLKPLRNFVLRGFAFKSDGRDLYFRGVWSDHDLDDITQETFRRAFGIKARESYDGIRPYKNYLFTIARNAVINDLMAKGRQIPVGEALTRDTQGEDLGPLEAFVLAHRIQRDGESAILSEERVENLEIYGLVSAFLEALTDEEKRFFEARFLAHQSQENTARLMGWNRARVRKLESRLRRAFLCHIQGTGYLDDKKETRVVRRPDDQGRARQVFARARAIWRERRAEASNEFLHEAA
ncbi:MAG: sigma-70 family RNA polymerase sigma factor [Myxococcota bacterium]